MFEILAKLPKNMLPNCLIVFVKNPIAGNVKTRLAKSIGEQGAVWVYERLLLHTKQLADRLAAIQKGVYYGDFVAVADLWDGYPKFMQAAGDLGLRMQGAFLEQLQAGAERVVIIGSDCAELRPEHLQAAFDELDRVEVVLGPSADGGYYLLGMRRLHAALFEQMPWSTPTLMAETVRVLIQQGISYTTLEVLHDLDDRDDYQRAVSLGLIPLYTE